MRTLIIGPPCGGKTTRAYQLGGLVIDRDDIARHQTGREGWDWTEPEKASAERTYHELVRQTRQAPDVTFVRSITLKHADAFAEYVNAEQIIIADPGKQEALRRAVARPAWTTDAIRRWYAE